MRWRSSRPTRDLQPEDAPEWIADRIRGETRDILIAGHYPHLPGLLLLLTDAQSFPQHGVVALQTDDKGKTWSELWRLEPGARG